MLSSRTSTVSSPATGTGSTVSGLIRLLRPKQWTKNLLLFAALLFSFEEIRTETILATLLGFILFSLVAGCVYILNDFVDRDRDRQHPVKSIVLWLLGRLIRVMRCCLALFY